VKAESKLWQKVKRNTPNITWTRVESWSSFGFPDLVGYTEKSGFFTVELKVTKSNKVALSPHQISFHVKHPTNTFILIQTRDACSPKLNENLAVLYPGSCALELSQLGLAAPGACELASWSELERLLTSA
tara:strand:- start:192 stop:581 length:390 start_codon:yes stop_codon:yes gene_type:complete